MNFLSYDLSKKLHNLGICFNAEKMWLHDPNDDTQHILSENDEYAQETSGLNPIEAPGFQDVWNLLPRSIEKNYTHYWLTLEKVDNNTTWITYEGLREDKQFVQPVNGSIVDAACKLLLELIEKKYLNL